MADKTGSAIVSNSIIVVILIALFCGMIKIGGGIDSSKFQIKDTYNNKKTLQETLAIIEQMKQKQKQQTETEEDFSTKINTVEPPVQTVPQTYDKISFSTAVSFFNTRELSKTENIVLTESKNFGKYFERGSNTKIVLYTNLNKQFYNGLQAKMKDYGKETNIKFINKHEIFPIKSEAAVKTTNDRVLFHIYKECINLCIMDIPNRKLYILKGTEVNKKTATILDVVLKSL